jgi:glucokinase
VIATVRAVAAVDIGGTTTRAAVAVGDELRGRVAVQTRPGEALAGAVAETVRAALDASGLAPGDVNALGVSVPGPLDAKRRSVAFTGNVGLRDYALAERLEAALDLPVTMDDDANCAALGEVQRGAAMGAGVAVLVVVGTGIGGGIVIDGRLYRGAHAIAGEVGHIVLEPDGPLCSCGHRGCFEALAAGPALAARGRSAAREGRSPALLEKSGGSVEAIDAADVIDAAKAGDAEALSAVAATGRYLGIGVAAVASMLDPDVIVLSGGLGGAPGMLEWARRGVREHCIAPLDSLVRVVNGSLGDDAGLWGAALLARGGEDAA